MFVQFQKEQSVFELRQFIIFIVPTFWVLKTEEEIWHNHLTIFELYLGVVLCPINYD